MAKRKQPQWRKFASYKIIAPIFFIVGLTVCVLSAASLLNATTTDEVVFGWMFLGCGLLFMAVPFGGHYLDKNYEADKGGKQYEACVCGKNPGTKIHLNVIERWWFFISVSIYVAIVIALILTFPDGPGAMLVPLLLLALLLFSDGTRALRYYRSGHTLICSAHFAILKGNDTEK